MLTTTLLFFSFIFVSEKYFPVYRVHVMQPDGSYIAYDIPKKNFFDESGMITKETIEKLEQK